VALRGLMRGQEGYTWTGYDILHVLIFEGGVLFVFSGSAVGAV